MSGLVPIFPSIALSDVQLNATEDISVWKVSFLPVIKLFSEEKIVL
jgi:hypothetical protein